MRTLALDVHARFAEVALHENGEVRRVGRIATKDLPAFAESLATEDHVVIESTSISWAIVDLIAQHAGRVTISNPMQTKAIAQAKVKTDKVDAKVLAQLGAADFLAEVWVPDRDTRALRRRCAHRQALVRQRTAQRVRVHAILQRNLLELPVTDVFGKKGRRLLEAATLPEHEREQVDSALRLHDALQAEIDEVERRLAREALASEDIRRLMTIPGIGPMTALGLVGVIGDIRRFPSHRHLVGYLGLDPKVRQSGEREARTGHISRQGQAHARALLCEAANAAVRVPGPLRAFFERLRARRGFGIALVATARKLAVVAWHMLRKGEDYRYGAPTLTQTKLQALERMAGAQGPRTRVRGDKERKALERRMLEQAEGAYRDLVAARVSGAGPHRGRALSSRLAANDARQAQGPQAPALLVRGRPRREGS